MKEDADPYAGYVPHPRFGRGPRYTGVNPSRRDPGVHLHWNTVPRSERIETYRRMLGADWPYGNIDDYVPKQECIAHTAVPADLTRQTPATIPVTHYLDLARPCRDCGRWFIFFAEEQKYWYEELGFSLNSDCIRCVDCRRRQQGIARQQETYESLVHILNKTTEQILQMAAACISLIDAGIFSTRRTQRVRELLNTLPDILAPADATTRDELRRRVKAIEDGA